MAGPAKTTVVNKSIRVAEGSALARLTEGKPFTETVHKMAELFETALAENWGPPAERSRATIHDMDVSLQPGRVNYVPEGGPRLPPESVLRQFMIGHDERTAQVVTEQELLRLAAEQAPAGLVAVGLDEEADELPREVEDYTREMVHNGQPTAFREMATPTPWAAYRELAKATSWEPDVLAASMEPDEDEDLSYLI